MSKATIRFRNASHCGPTNSWTGPLTMFSSLVTKAVSCHHYNQMGVRFRVSRCCSTQPALGRLAKRLNGVHALTLPFLDARLAKLLCHSN